MKIDRVSVRYGELRSSGHPSFSNTRHEIELAATIEPGETAADAKKQLTEIAVREVRLMFGDKDVAATPMELPLTG